MNKQTTAYLRIEFKNLYKKPPLEIYDFFKQYHWEPDFVEKCEDHISRFRFKSFCIEELNNQWGITIPLLKPVDYDSIDIFIQLAEELKNKLIKIYEAIPFQDDEVEIFLDYNIHHSIHYHGLN
jgi:hypothetical protein